MTLIGGLLGIGAWMFLKSEWDKWDKDLELACHLIETDENKAVEVLAKMKKEMDSTDIPGHWFLFKREVRPRCGSKSYVDKVIRLAETRAKYLSDS